MESERVSISFNSDSEGYFDKECPNEKCMYQFKVHGDDWQNLFKDEAVFCPLCRHEAKSKSWYTTEQVKNATEQTRKYVRGVIGNALGNTQTYHYFLPVESRKEMQLKVECKECHSRYAVIGSAFFCPCCGHNSVDETFDQSIKKIENKIKNIPIIKKAIEEISLDEAETTCRSLIETSLNEGVVAFQRFCEKKFSDKYPTVKIKFNAFQNLAVGGNYWKDNYGKTYSDWLTHDEFEQLNILFQKRHLLSHTEGIVDQRYIDKSKDTEYNVGQRIVIKEIDVKEMLKLILKITNEIKTI